MTSMHDAAKKPSIVALLNTQPTSHPQIPGTSPTNAYHRSPPANPQGYQNRFATPSFLLSTANWQPEQYIPAGHHRHGSEPQQFTHMPHNSYVYGSPVVEPMGGHYPGRSEPTHHRWQSHPAQLHPPQFRQADISGGNDAYAPMPSQSQSDTAQSLAGSKLTRTDSSQACQNPGAYDSHDFSVSDYQPSERVSVRLAARELAPTPQTYAQQRDGSHRSDAGRPSSYGGTTHHYSHGSQATSSSHTTETSNKRQLSEEEVNASAPKPKRVSKARPKAAPVQTEGSPAPPKRPLNSRKRSEAGQLVLHPEYSVPAVAFSTDEGKEGNRLPPFPDTVKVKVEFQHARCMSAKYKSDIFPRCVSCTRRWAGDTCRFQNIRYLLRNQEDNALLGVAFVDKADQPPLQFTDQWNIPIAKVHIDRIKRVIANALLPTMQVDRHHLTLPELVKRARECELRVTCDSCMTSIFSTSWFCRLCGREVCPDCYSTIKTLTHVPHGASRQVIQAMRIRREEFVLSHPIFLACNRRGEHEAWQFSPMSRFVESELDEAISEMERIQREAGPPTVVGSAVTDGRSTMSGNPVSTPAVPPAPVAAEVAKGRPWSEVYLDNQTKASYLPPDIAPSGAAGVQYIPPDLTPAAAIVPTLEPYRFTDPEVSGPDSMARFSAIWAHGEPIVVSNILNKFKINWTPEYFINNFGDRPCVITECEKARNEPTTIGRFFSTFGKYEGRAEVWKLKDWPPSADFKTAFPALYEDFSNAVPVPDYVRRDGVYNIASHFPANAVAPDLGPKMYNAHAGKQGSGSNGTTRLHMDMADALNVMLYSADCPDGSPGCALWDIFRACDSDKIRAFLKPLMQAEGTDKRPAPIYDPIHGQQFYLDDEMRLRLYNQYGVKSYRIYQRPGEAIFIPAGCAHQVLNMSDSIKIAIDYVSPENIDRCAQLTREFREQNKANLWKEDILQLRAMMWFAWRSCCHSEKKLATSASSTTQPPEEELPPAPSGSSS